MKTNGLAMVRSAQAHHPRIYQANRYVYPVLSRRSRGISVGINLNPDKVCNFDCIYCQVDRTTPPIFREVDLERLVEEARQVLTSTIEGNLYEVPPFAGLPETLRRVNDIAFSGDGEPTSYPEFREAVERIIAVRDELGLQAVKLLVITNATLFHRPYVREGLALMDRNNGEIWAKLDAGSEAYYHLIERTTIKFERVVRNLIEAAQVRPLVVQSLFMRVHGNCPDDAEIEAFCGVLQRILDAGGGLKLIQVYTIARPPAESWVTPLSDREVDQIGARVRDAVPVPVETYYGTEGEENGK